MKETTEYKPFPPGTVRGPYVCGYDGEADAGCQFLVQTAGGWVPFIGARHEEVETRARADKFALEHKPTTITPQADAVRPLRPTLPNEPAMCEPCPNCGKVSSELELAEIKDIFLRVDPGEPMPAGECPECGALCHIQSTARQLVAGKPLHPMLPLVRVIVEVQGGCAEVTTCPPGVEVEIIDHDNEEAGR